MKSTYLSKSQPPKPRVVVVKNSPHLSIKAGKQKIDVDRKNAALQKQKESAALAMRSRRPPTKTSSGELTEYGKMKSQYIKRK